MTINSFDRYEYSVVERCFTLWLFSVLLFLSGIPTVGLIIHSILKTPIWTVPKIYELKMYAIIMFMCALLPFLDHYIPRRFKRLSTHYKLYMMVFYPLTTVLYCFGNPHKYHYISVFILSLGGIALYIYDGLYEKETTLSYINKHYYQLLALSLFLTTLIVLYSSTDNVVHLFSWWSLIVFVMAMLFIQYVNFKNKFLVLPFLCGLFLVTFYSNAGYDPLHTGFFIGPVLEVLYGHAHPLTLDIQYGGGLTAFLAAYYKVRGAVTDEGMQDLLKALTFIEYTLVFFVAEALYHSRKIAFIALLAILFFNFYSVGAIYYGYPSIGALRFGFIYLILFTWLLEGAWLSQRTVFFIVSILGSLAFIWSFESAVYTIPALFFAEYVNKSFKKFFPVFLGCFSLIVLAYLSPILFQGKWPEFWRYYEYPLLYANGLAQMPLTRLANIWWFFPLIYGFFLIKIMSGALSSKLISALTVYGALLFTYFGGRSASPNIFHVSIPFILLSIYFILNLKTVTHFTKHIFLSCVLVVILSQDMVWGGTGLVALNFWNKNLVLFKKNIVAVLMNTTPKIPSVNDKYCAAFQPLHKYIENNSIAIMNEHSDFYHFYACTKTHNAFGLNPYLEISSNPFASNRAILKAEALANRFILVDSDLIRLKSSLFNKELPQSILQKISVKMIEELKVDDTTYIVYENKRVAHL